MTHPLWPLFDLRIRSEHLVLRLPTDDELIDLAALARSGIHGEDEMPFGVPWSTRPSPEFEIGFVQHHWTMRGTWTPEKWWLNLAVERDGTWVAAQTIAADGFAVHHVVDTGSWVARRFQRQGIGKEMRGAVLAFAFDHLGANVAESEAFLDNAASNAVSQEPWLRAERVRPARAGGRVAGDREVPHDQGRVGVASAPHGRSRRPRPLSRALRDLTS